jgi:hypothetical protein
MRPSPYAGMLFNGLGRPINLDKPAPTLPASMGGNKTPIIDQHALETDDPHWVVGYHAHLRGGGEPFTSVPSRLRRLTVEECALIQSFPIGYRFAGKQSSRFHQIGNAVPPLLAFAIAERLRSYLTDDEHLLIRAKQSPARAGRRMVQTTFLELLSPTPSPAERHDKGRCKICRLQGAGFWVDMADCELLKTYEGRTVGHYGRSSSRYTTLGSLRKFVERQREAEARGDKPCAACGKRWPLCEDMEDGLMKCHRCCDMPE